MKIALLLALLSLSPFGNIKADNTTDSLLSLIDKAAEDEEVAILYTSLAKQLAHTHPDSAIFYAEKGLELSNRISYELGSAENAAALGDIYVANDNLEQAKVYYTLAVEHFKKKDNLFDVTQISLILGNISLAQNQYFEALKIYQECLDVSLEYDFNSLTPHLYNNTSEIYQEIGDLIVAKEQLEKARELFEEQGDEYHVAMCMLNLAWISNRSGNHDEAIIQYLDVIRLFSALESWQNIANVYNSIAQIHIDRNESSKAEEYTNLALNIIENNNDIFEGPSSIYSTKIFTNVARLAFVNNDLERSMRFAKKSLALSYTNKYAESILENSRLISDIFERQGQIDSSLFYSRIVIQYVEEIQEEDNIKKITQLRMKYEFDEMLREKELENVKRMAVQHQREMIYVGLLAIVLLSIIILLLLYRNQKSKADRAILRREKIEMERAQLNQKLKYKNRELTTKMMYLLEKNESHWGLDQDIFLLESSRT